MGGRELRAALLFVLISLVVGAGYREWRARASGGADGPTFIERLRTMEDDDRLDGEQGWDAAGLAAGGRARTQLEADSAPARMGSAPSAWRSRGGATSERGPALGSLDVDRASAADWERLPGIGPALAARIVADRGERGPFHGPEGLLRVRGIGAKTLARLRPFLRAAPVDSVSPFAK